MARLAMKMYFKPFAARTLICSLALLAGGCLPFHLPWTQAPDQSNAVPAAASAPQLSPAPASSALAAATNPGVNPGGAAGAPRRLQPNDILDVSVYQEPDLTAHTSVDAQGMVMLPLLGAVKLGGLTLEEATQKVRDLYDKDYLVKPNVTIQLFKMAVLRFTILGQVKNPGTYDFPPNEELNLLDGIAIAGGYTRLAQPAKVTVQRNVDGQLKIFELDGETMAKDPLHKPFLILPGDTITVSERVF